MTPEEIRLNLNLGIQSNQRIQWLRDTYFPEIIQRFNQGSTRKKFGIYQHERLPQNERNLTDVRTRMGILIEFEIARLCNLILQENGISEFFWSYVIANRFPDLEIRENTGELLLRFEVKCLQTVAEEKAANFSTLLKDINPHTDYVIVCLWDWSDAPNLTYHWDAAPKLFRIYIFNAYSLALLRDTYWLNRAPDNLGNGFQGFDIRYAITCTHGNYSKEQGNYGKLTRIWKKDFPYRPPETPDLLDTEHEYLDFQQEIVLLGFEVIALKHLCLLGAIEQRLINKIDCNENFIAYTYNHIGYVLFKKNLTQREFKNIAKKNKLKLIIKMTEKYKSTIFLFHDEKIKIIKQNIKPKNIMMELRPAMLRINLL